MEFVDLKMLLFLLAARANCMLENGDLLSITSFEEYSFIRSQMYPLRARVSSFWLGLNSRDSKYTYSWSDGSGFSTAQWSSGYPFTFRDSYCKHFEIIYLLSFFNVDLDKCIYRFPLQSKTSCFTKALVRFNVLLPKGRYHWYE